MRLTGDLPILCLAQYQHQEVPSFLAFHSLLLRSQPKENDIFRVRNVSENHEDNYNKQIPLQFWTTYSAVAHITRAALIILKTVDISLSTKHLQKV